MNYIGVFGPSSLIENTPSELNKSMFYYIQSCGHFLCDKNYFTDRVDYNSILLLYTIKGKGVLKYRNKQYTLNPGQIFIIDCNNHQYYGTDSYGIWEFKFIHFNGSGSKKYVERIIENFGPVISMDVDNLVCKNINRILEMISVNDTRMDIVSSLYIVEILTELLLNGNDYERSNDNIPIYVKKTVEEIENKYSGKLSLDNLSKQVNIDKYYLTKQFKKYFGYSPHEYLVNYRISKSKELLKNTQIPICEIAERIGFDSVSHFIKTFNKKETTTPFKFRKFWS